jgi:hypothetical protein
MMWTLTKTPKVQNNLGMGNLQTNNIIKIYNSQTCQVLGFSYYSNKKNSTIRRVITS